MHDPPEPPTDSRDPRAGLDIPTCDDKPIWDVWLSMLWLPAVTVADELEIFESLAREPATAAELAQRHGFQLRGADILLSLLTALKFCVSHLGRYQVTEPTRNYLLRASPFYWGGVFFQQRTLQSGARDDPGRCPEEGAPDHRPVGQGAAGRNVESGEMTLDAARGIAAFMHSHSLAAATGMALRFDLSGVKSLLDVGGGSGCFCITLAKQNPQLRCAVMDLKPMCEVALDYIRAGGVADRVGTQAVNMFQQQWPQRLRRDAVSRTSSTTGARRRTRSSSPRRLRPFRAAAAFSCTRCFSTIRVTVR